MGHACTESGMVKPEKPRGCLQVAMPWALLALDGAGRCAQGSTTLALMQQHAALLIMRSRTGGNLNSIPFCQAELRAYYRRANFQYAVFRAFSPYPAVASGRGRPHEVHLGFQYFF